MKRIKMQKGITLIALIITIIVLLILSGVAIASVSDSGIIRHAKNAQVEHEIGEEKEKVTLATSEAYLAGLGTITKENLDKGLESNFGTGEYSLDSSNSEYFKITVTKSGREYKVYKNGKVEGTLGSIPEEGGDDIIIPPEKPNNIIPEGGQYKRIDEDSNETIWNPGEPFPDIVLTGDIYTYGDYEYRYNCVFMGEWADIDIVKNMAAQNNMEIELANGWGVRVIDTNKTEYDTIISQINGENVTNMFSTYSECELLEIGPGVPSTIVNMYDAFRECGSLYKAPDMSNANNLIDMGAAFYNCDKLTSITTLPSNVKNMNRTFMDCSALTEVVSIPSSVTNMSFTFQYCSALEKAPDMSNAINVVNMLATFDRCISLKEVENIPSNVNNMKSTFLDCSSLTKVAAIPSTVTDMTWTFEGCTALQETPDMSNATGVTTMEHAFCECTSLIKVNSLPPNVLDMKAVFYGCTKLISVTSIPQNVVTIESAFSMCSDLITAPDMSNAINLQNMMYTFRGCTSLTTVALIPSNVVQLYGAFENCAVLEGDIEVNISKDLESCDNCFRGTTKPIKLIGSASTSVKAALAGTSGNVTY